MIVSILTYICFGLELIAIGAGAMALFGLLTGVLLNKWTVLFLKCSLATGVTALLIPFEHFTLTQEASMLSVYGAGVVVLAWRKFQLMGVWRSIFAWSITLVLYLNIVVAITQVSQRISLFKPPIPSRFDLPFITTQSVVLAIFLVLGIVVVNKFSNKSTHALRSRRDEVSNKHAL
ncbi:MAG TPA: hypothetical protein VHZ52_06160 [Acidobacteriaceae bacterium]|jgi:hypothetical protein|nr:hypothetical protein [Acidobacteriaceae bacterium]